MKVLLFHDDHLIDLLDTVEQKKGNQQDLAGHDKVVIYASIADESHDGVKSVWNDAASSGELKHYPDCGKHVHVCVVDGKVNEDGPCAPFNPQILFQLLNSQLCMFLVRTEHLCEAVAGVVANLGAALPPLHTLTSPK
jgi:hypothetical protein